MTVTPAGRPLHFYTRSPVEPPCISGHDSSVRGKIPSGYPCRFPASTELNRKSICRVIGARRNPVYRCPPLSSVDGPFNVIRKVRRASRGASCAGSAAASRRCGVQKQSERGPRRARRHWPCDSSLLAARSRRPAPPLKAGTWGKISRRERK